MKIAVLLPCYNEEQTIGKVIADFRTQLPDADIYVYDNNSTDRSVSIAQQDGARVVRERRQGKGNVIRSMFRDIEADVYVMADADDTYPAEVVHEVIEPIIKGEADMVVGDRLSNDSYAKQNKRAFHEFGNNLVIGLINKLFESSLSDVMSGYRAFNRKFVKNIPVMSAGFEVETEMTLHALDKRFAIVEVPIHYRDRPAGSFSKLRTFQDGIKVIRTIFWVFKDYKPLTFFLSAAGVFFVSGLVVGIPVIVEFTLTRMVLKIPSAILATGLMSLGLTSLVCGTILDTIVAQHRKDYELMLNRGEARRG